MNGGRRGGEDNGTTTSSFHEHVNRQELGFEQDVSRQEEGNKMDGMMSLLGRGYDLESAGQSHTYTAKGM